MRWRHPGYLGLVLLLLLSEASCSPFGPGVEEAEGRAVIWTDRSHQLVVTSRERQSFPDNITSYRATLAHQRGGRLIEIISGVVQSQSFREPRATRLPDGRLAFQLLRILCVEGADHEVVCHDLDDLGCLPPEARVSCCHEVDRATAQCLCGVEGASELLAEGYNWLAGMSEGEMSARIAAAVALARIGHPSALARTEQLLLHFPEDLWLRGLEARATGDSHLLGELERVAREGSHCAALTLARSCVPELVPALRRRRGLAPEEWSGQLGVALESCRPWSRVPGAPGEPVGSGALGW